MCLFEDSSENRKQLKESVGMTWSEGSQVGTELRPDSALKTIVSVWEAHNLTSRLGGSIRINIF